MTDDFFHALLGQIIDSKPPLALLAQRKPWRQIETALASSFSRKAKEGQTEEGEDLFCPTLTATGVGLRGLPLRLMASLLYLKHANNLSDERWSGFVVWRHFSGMDYYNLRLQCDASQVGRFRTFIYVASVE